MELLKDILEIIYYLTTPVIAFIAFKALGQIREAKNQVTETKKNRQINSTRESFKLAAEKCEYYLTHIIPRMNTLDDSISEQNISFFDESEVIISNSQIEVKPKFKNEEERKLLYGVIPNLEVYNPLEGFCLFFTSGIADENIGYLTLGQTFAIQEIPSKYCSVIRWKTFY